VKASDRFDPSRGVAFATFATPAIEGEIRRHLDDHAPSVKIPRDLQKTSRNVRRQQAELAAKLGRFPTNAEVAEALKIDEAEIERAVTAGRAGDRVAVSPGDEAWEAAATSEPLDGSDNKMLLAASMRALTERERRIVLLRFHGDLTERQIAQTVGISQAHVSRLLDGALTKLRAELGEGEPPASRRTSRDIRPNRVISHVSDSKIATVGAQETSSGHRSKQKQTSGYSGKFLVRMPSELHEQLAHAAQREDMSLNRFVTEVLATSVGEQSESGQQAAAGEAEPAPSPSARLSPSAVRVALATNLVVVVVAGLAAVILLVLALQRGI
jgi:RNA polymerase sigma-B factor